MSTLQRAAPIEIKPLKNLGFWHIWALGVGAVVGDGIFLLLGAGIQTAGPSSVLSFFLAGVLQLFLMLALIELAVGMPSAGAMGPWVERFMGPWWGYLAGFSWAFAWVIVGGAVSIALGRFLSWYIPLHELILAGLAMTIFALLNIFGALVAARTQLYMTVGLVVIMAGLAIFGLPKAVAGIPGNFIPFAPMGWKAMFLAIPLGAYAYMGTACLCTAGAECKNVRDLPRALIWASLTFIILYTLAQIVAIATVPWGELSMAESPYVTAAQVIFGRLGAGIVNFGAVLAAATCLLMGTLYSASRIFYDEARAGKMPAIFGYLHPKYRTPVWGIVIIWAVSIAIIAIAYWSPDLVYVTFTMQFLVASFISYGLSIAAAILYRRKFPDEVGKLPFRMPVPVLTFALAIGGTVMTAYFAFIGTPQTLPLALVWIIPVYLWYRSRPSAFRATTTGTAVQE
jgi:amino acid transporter